MWIVKRIITLIIVVYECTGAEYAEQTSLTPSTKTCKAPSQPQNGHWRLNQLECTNGQDCDIPEGVKLAVGSHLIYSCNPGYIITGSSDVSCSSEGEWLNIPVCTGPLTMNIYINDTKFTLHTTLDRNNATYIEVLKDKVVIHTNGSNTCDPSYSNIECGKTSGVVPLNFNSQPTPGNISEFPWHASIYYGKPGNPKRYSCGATIIKKNLLITAAHCVYDEFIRQIIDTNNIHIVTGNIFRDYDSPLHDPHTVKKNKVKNIYIRCYYQGLRGNYMSDIAILELVEPFVLSSFLVPICIDHSSNPTMLEAGMYGRLAIFGESSQILQALSKPYVSFNQCNSAAQIADTEQFITIDKFCAGYTNGSFCEGSGGSGLVFQTDGLWYLRGVTSTSLGTIKREGNIHCDPKSYTLYTRVSNHIEWIQDVVAKLERNLPVQQCQEQEKY